MAESATEPEPAWNGSLRPHANTCRPAQLTYLCKHLMYHIDIHTDYRTIVKNEVRFGAINSVRKFIACTDRTIVEQLHCRSVSLQEHKGVLPHTNRPSTSWEKKFFAKTLIRKKKIPSRRNWRWHGRAPARRLLSIISLSRRIRGLKTGHRS